MQKIKRQLFKYLPSIKIILSLLTIGAVIIIVWRWLPSLSRASRSLLKIVRPISLRQHQGRINLLILGAGGANHRGPELTDSIMFVSIKAESGKTLLLSIPRDIWVASMRAKINSAYYYGEEKKPGGGLVLAKAAVSEILGQPIHYVILVDFAGFVRAVDLVGGVEIDVANTFDDYKYPIPGMEEAEPEELRYEHLHFDAGWQHMDGERALKYIRSRYAEGDEGTDFARSQRQQKFLLAFKNKAFSLKTLFNLNKIKALIKVFSQSIKTDIKEEEYPGFLKLALKLKKAELKTEVLSEDFLYHPPQDQYDNQWVLIPKTGDWSQVQEYIEQKLD